MDTIFWYDFETTGINPSTDRPLQVAGIRTNWALEVVDEPLNFYSQLSADILPSLRACLVTGITPQQLAEQGLSEVEFITQLRAQMLRPGTCNAGYNNIRFDDEMLRYSLYRNFYDPYAHEWQGNNSRWDLIDALRCAYALRPEGINWPLDDSGRVSLRLELLTKANGIEHGQAHDALADVYATIALARCLQQHQPQLFSYLFNLRVKSAVLQRIKLLQPLLHISGKFAASRHYLAPVLPLAWHPKNKNALIVCDLHSDLSPLFELTAEQLREALYTAHDTLLAQGKKPVPLKLLHINKCPVIAPLGVLREQDKQRLNWSDRAWQDNYQQLVQRAALVQSKVSAVFDTEGWANQTAEVETQLYAGFFGPRDKGLFERIHQEGPEVFAQISQAATDKRVPALLARFQARNFYSSLTEQQQAQWLSFCRQRLTQPEHGAPRTLAQIEQELIELTAEEQAMPIIQHWLDYIRQLQQQLSMS